MIPTPLEADASIRTRHTAVRNRAPGVTVSLVLAALPVLAVWTLSHPTASLAAVAAVLVATVVFEAAYRHHRR